MATKVLDEVLEKIDQLNPEEKQHVMDALSGKESKPHLKWADLVGVLPYPSCGEDAQDYITRTRREAEEDRIIR